MTNQSRLSLYESSGRLQRILFQQCKRRQEILAYMKENSDLKTCDIRFEYTEQFSEILSQLNCSLLVSTYQAGKVITIGTQGNSLEISFINAEKPMGVAVSSSQEIAVGTYSQIESWKLVSQSDSGSDNKHSPVTVTRQNLSHFDRTAIKQLCYSTGNIQIHEIAWIENELWFVNTRFSSLCTLKDGFSFYPEWQPSFVSEMDDRDRCHLNGMAVDSDEVKLVTVLGQTDSPAGWRDCKLNGGAVIDVPSGETICAGLCMPHSPRIYAGQQWVLNSGHGLFGILDRQSGDYQPVQFMPGFLRGLAFYENYAFVGLSKARESATFGDLPVMEKCNEMKCGVGIVDLRSGETVAVLKFNEGISEIFSVEVLPGCSNPFFANSVVDGDEPRELWMLPRPN